MLLGLSLAAFTQLHVAISLIGIVAGLVVFGAMLGGRWLGVSNAVFLAFTILDPANVYCDEERRLSV